MIIILSGKKQSIQKLEVRGRMLGIDLEIENLKSARETDKIECDRKIQDLTIQLQKSPNEQTILKEDLLDIEKRERRLSLKFTNVPDRLCERREECERNFMNMLNKCGLQINPLSITKIHRIGAITRYKPSGPLIVSFHHPKQRNYILFNSLKLKHVGNIMIEEDLPEEIRRMF